MAMNYQARREKVRSLLEEKEADAFLSLNLADIRYLTGFSGSSAAVLVGREKSIILTDLRYRLQVKKEVTGMEMVVREVPLPESLFEVAKKEGMTRILYDPAHLSHAQYQEIRNRLKRRASLQPLPREVSKFREIKDDSEIALMRRAVKISERALLAVLKGSPLEGRNTRYILAELEGEMLLRGGEDHSFPTILLTGSKTALPHGKSSSQVLREGSGLLVDFGAIYQGYHADITRTVWIGKPPARLCLAHEVVLEAQRRVMGECVPGVPAARLDQLSREVIAEGGFGRYISHSLGHGVGLETHEGPYLTSSSEDVLKEGMVFTLEPGIYIPGLGGVRVEDMVTLTAQGPKRLTTLPGYMRYD